ncbi:rCG57669 [Rattus norvegicus]|uniref:RCG57669 n=1 Tax=Rattus norvegicus TaxID=10116 RepID=A6JI54_RAT|nr:rCG57669 [Rattus norvegicus]
MLVFADFNEIHRWDFLKTISNS